MSTKKTADRKPTLILGDGTVLYESQAKPVKLTPSELAEAVKNLGEYVAEYRTWLRDRRDDDVLPAYRWLRLDYPTRMELLAEAGGDDVTVLSIKIGMNYCLRQTATLLSKRADRYGLDPLPIRKAVQRCDFTDPNLAELARRDRIDLDNLTPLPPVGGQAREQAVPMWRRLKLRDGHCGAIAELDGQPHRLRSPADKIFLETLQQARGLPVKGRVFEKMGLRPDRVYARLPGPIKAGISAPGRGQQGYCML
jgi:hypothetical protein